MFKWLAVLFGSEPGPLESVTHGSALRPAGKKNAHVGDVSVKGQVATPATKPSGPLPRPATKPQDERAFAPHCDQSVLHAPSVCQHCDKYPDWQELRERWRINFTGENDPTKAPCPATHFRSLDTINRWGGNVAYKPTPEELRADEMMGKHVLHLGTGTLAGRMIYHDGKSAVVQEEYATGGAGFATYPLVLLELAE